MAGDYGDASLARTLIIEVHRADGLLLIGPPWLKGSEPFRVSESGGRSLYTRDRFWLLRTIRADPNALQRLRAIWNQFDPMISVGRLSDYELAGLVSDAIVRQNVAALFLSNTPTAAFTAAQNQVQGTQHGASGSWDRRDLSETDTRPVPMWSNDQKIFYAFRQALKSSRITGDLEQALVGFIFGPRAVRYIAAIAVWIALQIVPGANVTVDGVAMILAWSLAGYIGIKALIDFVKATIDAIQATSTRELDVVADRYVDDLISLGALFLPKLVSKLNGGGGGSEDIKAPDETPNPPPEKPTSKSNTNPDLPKYTFQADPNALVQNGSIQYGDIKNWANSGSLDDQWVPAQKFSTGGFKYNSSDNYYDYTIWGHGINPSAPPGSNSSLGPTASIARQPIGGIGKEYLLSNGQWGDYTSNENVAHIPLENSPY